MKNKHFKRPLTVEDVLSLYPNFALEDAGGGGRVWRHPTNDGGQIIVTGMGTPFAPCEDAREVTVGRYDKGYIDGKPPLELHRRCPVKELEKVLDNMLGFSKEPNS